MVHTKLSTVVKAVRPEYASPSTSVRATTEEGRAKRRTS